MTAVAALLLVVLASGFIYSTICLPVRYFSAREIGHRLYFRSTVYALFLLVSAFLVFLRVSLVLGVELPVSDLYLLPSLLLGGEWGYLIQLLTVPLAIVFSLSINVVFSIPFFTEWLLSRAIEHRDFEKLVFQSLKKSLPMMITLTDGKVYVGFAVASPDPSLERKFLRILPLISGYRGDVDKKVEFTTYYDEIIEAVQNSSDEKLSYRTLEDIEVVLPSDAVISAHLFDLTIHSMFTGDYEADSDPGFDDDSDIMSEGL